MVDKINSMFYSHPIYHLFAGSIKILEDKCIVKSMNEFHHINHKDILNVELKPLTFSSPGYLQIKYKKHNLSKEVFLYFKEDSTEKMNELYKKLKNCF